MNNSRATILQQLFINHFTWKLVATIGMVDVLWLWGAGIGIEGKSPATILFLLILAGCVMTSLIYRHYRNDEVMYLFFQSASQLIIGAALVTCMSYLSARLALPLRDQQLIAADQFVHFNWLAWLNWLNDWPTLARVLTLAYESTDLQFFVLLMALLFCKRTDRLQKLILTFFLSGIMVVTLGAMFPAVAGYIYYNIDLSQIPHLHPAAPRDQEIMLMGMREHTINILPLKFDGIVQFPSFHSVLAILFMYASMPVRWLRTIIVPLNLLMVISTPVDGGHYLMDIVAGIGIAFIAIYAANRLFKHIPAQVPASAQPELIAA